MKILNKETILSMFRQSKIIGYGWEEERDFDLYVYIYGETTYYLKWFYSIPQKLKLCNEMYDKETIFEFNLYNMFLPTLYKRSITGKISQWIIEIEENKFRTTSGYTDGQNFTGDWTECFPKNVGKKNSTTANEQAEFEARAKWKKKVEKGFFDSIDKVDQPTIFLPMLAQEWTKRKSKIKYPHYSQPKLDGIRCIIHSGGMFSRQGKEIISAPHIMYSLKPVFEKHPDLILDGELFAERSVCDFNKIISLVRKTKPTYEDLMESSDYIQYWIYDIPSCDENWEGRMSELHKLFKEEIEEIETCVLVPTYIVNSEEEVINQFRKYIDNGFEGQMLRSPDNIYETDKRSNGLIKHKEFIDEEYEIKGFKEGSGKLAGRIGTLLFERNGVPFEAAVNGDHSYLAELFENVEQIIGKMATVKYFELTTTENPVPRFGKVVCIRDYEG